MKKNLAPRRDRWMKGAVKRPGKLSNLAAELGQPKKPFMKRSMAEQKAVLDLCVKKYGYRSCLGSTMFLRNVPSIRKSPKMRARATALKDYLVQRHGGRKTRKNPRTREWKAIPVILAGYDMTAVRLTETQVVLLTKETG